MLLVPEARLEPQVRELFSSRSSEKPPAAKQQESPRNEINVEKGECKILDLMSRDS